MFHTTPLIDVSYIFKSFLLMHTENKKPSSPFHLLGREWPLLHAEQLFGAAVEATTAYGAMGD